jgi:hypothetical protein
MRDLFYLASETALMKQAGFQKWFETWHETDAMQQQTHKSKITKSQKDLLG